MSSKSWRKQLDASQMPLLPFLLAQSIRLLYKTCRFTIIGQQHYQYGLQLSESGKPVLCSFWHFAFPTIAYFFYRRDAVVMVSRSRDGEFAARLLAHLGYRIARGSPGKGGVQALKKMISTVNQGRHAGIIADGSQGPARVAQKGILILARYAQAPILPVSIAANPCWQFRSWDRTVLAKPFGHVVVAFGAPILLSRDASAADMENARQLLEDRLSQITRDAEHALDGNR